jgi:hypothetical protein
MKHCPTCGQQYDDGSGNFCVRDGTPLVVPAASPVAPPPAAHAPAFPPPQSVTPLQQVNPVSPLPSAPPLKAAPQTHPGDSAAAQPLQRIKCEWCQGMNEANALSCRACGAPLDIKNLVSESGWREAPRIKDMTEIHFGSSTCQVEGEIVPVAEISLGAGDTI